MPVTDSKIWVSFDEMMDVKTFIGNVVGILSSEKSGQKYLLTFKGTYWSKE